MRFFPILSLFFFCLQLCCSLSLITEYLAVHSDKASCCSHFGLEQFCHRLFVKRNQKLALYKCIRQLSRMGQDSPPPHPINFYTYSSARFDGAAKTKEELGFTPFFYDPLFSWLCALMQLKSFLFLPWLIHNIFDLFNLLSFQKLASGSCTGHLYLRKRCLSCSNTGLIII